MIGCRGNCLVGWCFWETHILPSLVFLQSSIMAQQHLSLDMNRMFTFIMVTFTMVTIIITMLNRHKSYLEVVMIVVDSSRDGGSYKSWM